MSRPFSNRGDDHDTHQGQRAFLSRAKGQGHFRHKGAEENQEYLRTQAADHGGNDRGPQRLPGHPLLGHKLSVFRGGYGIGVARYA